MRHPFLPWISGLLLASPLAAQTGTLDQVSPYSSEAGAGASGASYNISTSSLTWQMQTEAGLSGTLAGVEFELLGAAGAQMEVSIHLGTGWQTGTPVFTGMYTKTTATTELAWVDMSSANIVLNAGDDYLIQLIGNDTGMNATGTYETPANNQYPRELYLNGNPFNPEWRIGFHTFVQEDALQLTVSGNCGGFMTFDIAGATANSPVSFVRATGTGSFVIPGGPCIGTVLGLDASAQFVATLNSDAAGSLNVTRGVPPGACGVIYVQAIDVSTCATSNVVLLQ